MDAGRVIPENPLDFIRSCVRERKLLWTYHVQMRLAGRSVPRMVILDLADDAEVIESYPDDKYLPSYLVLTTHSGVVFHILFAADVPIALRAPVELHVLALHFVVGDAVAKLEAMLTRLEREENLKLVWYRTGPKQVQSNLLPYIVEVVAADKPGILFQLADFFDRQGITVESLHCSRYRAMQTGADMFSSQITVGVPASMHIAALRDDFLEFCDHLNLDAIMDPMKF